MNVKVHFAILPTTTIIIIIIIIFVTIIAIVVILCELNHPRQRPCINQTNISEIELLLSFFLLFSKNCTRIQISQIWQWRRRRRMCTSTRLLHRCLSLFSSLAFSPLALSPSACRSLQHNSLLQQHWQINAKWVGTQVGKSCLFPMLSVDKQVRTSFPSFSFYPFFFLFFFLPMLICFLLLIICHSCHFF